MTTLAVFLSILFLAQTGILFVDFTKMLRSLETTTKAERLQRSSRVFLDIGLWQLTIAAVIIASPMGGLFPIGLILMGLFMIGLSRAPELLTGHWEDR